MLKERKKKQKDTGTETIVARTEESEKSGFIKCFHSEKLGLDSRSIRSQGERFKFDGEGERGPSALWIQAHLQAVYREHFPGQRPRKGGGPGGHWDVDSSLS